MGKVLEFPADRIQKGEHCYTPEMGQRKVSCQLEATLGHYGKHYYVNTPLELKGRGITYLDTFKSHQLTQAGQRKVGWHSYRVTVNAFSKLKEAYSVSREMLLD